MAKHAESSASGGDPDSPEVEIEAVRSHREVLERAGKAAPFARLLQPIPGHLAPEAPVLLEHVAGPAHAFVCGLVAERLHSAAGTGRLWVLAKDLRLQENLHNELTTWWGSAHTLFFPEQEINQFADALPDPDITA